MSELQSHAKNVGYDTDRAGGPLSQDAQASETRLWGRQSELKNHIASERN